VLASIDASRALLEREGKHLLDGAIKAAREARDSLAAIKGMVALDGPGIDPLKLTLVLPGTGVDGNAVEQDLLDAGLPVESADRDVIVAVVSLADTAESLDAFATAVASSVERHRGTPRPVVGPSAYTVDPVIAMPPRQAFFAERDAVPIDRAVGRVSAELVAPYPPGIPVLAPGEEITAATLDSLEQARAAGVRIAYAAYPTLATLQEIRE
jgi:lysine decarboxylase